MHYHVSIEQFIELLFQVRKDVVISPLRKRLVHACNCCVKVKVLSVLQKRNYNLVRKKETANTKIGTEYMLFLGWYSRSSILIRST